MDRCGSGPLTEELGDFDFDSSSGRSIILSQNVRSNLSFVALIFIYRCFIRLSLRSNECRRVVVIVAVSVGWLKEFTSCVKGCVQLAEWTTGWDCVLNAKVD